MSEDNKISEIDKLIAAAKARKAAKAALKTEGAEDSASDETAAPADKSAAKAARAAAREEAKAKRDAERSARKEARAAARTGKAAHMSKVEKAAGKLPSLSEGAQLILSDATANLTAAQVAALALHLQHFNRVKATERALSTKIEAGVTVSIIGGDPRFIGQTGTVTKAQRIRCYVAVDGHEKPVYLFTSDVALAAAAAAPAATGTEG